MNRIRCALWLLELAATGNLRGATGFVADALRRHGVEGARVAPPGK